MKTVEQILLERIHELETELDGVKTDLAHEVDRLEDAAEYWQEQFVQLFNAIHRAVNLDPEEFSDGDVVDSIYTTLNTYAGQSELQNQL